MFVKALQEFLIHPQIRKSAVHPGSYRQRKLFCRLMATLSKKYEQGTVNRAG